MKILIQLNVNKCSDGSMKIFSEEHRLVVQFKPVHSLLYCTVCAGGNYAIRDCLHDNLFTRYNDMCSQCCSTVKKQQKTSTY